MLACIMRCRYLVAMRAWPLGAIAALLACTPTRTTGSAPTADGVVTSPPPRIAVPTPLAAVPIAASAAPSLPDAAPPVVSAGAGILPDERLTVWNPGLMSVGGIPARTAIFKAIPPSGGDDTATIQAALDACPPNQVVQLEAGTYNITGLGLVVARSNVVLRGRGPDKTRLVKKKGNGYPVIIIGRRWYKYTQPTDLSVSAAKGQYSVTLVKDPGLKVGELVMLDEVTDESLTYWGDNAPKGSPPRGWFCRPDRPMGQVAEVAKVSGTTVTFTTPLHIGLLKASSPQLVRFATDADFPAMESIRYSGIEDLYVSHGEGGDGGGNIHLFATSYSWVKNIESDLSEGQGVNFDGAFRSELRDSYVHSTVDPNPGGGGYGVGVNSHSADNLIENNAIWAFNKVDVFRASGGGNVFAYNYLEDGYGSGYPQIAEVGLSASHFTTPHHELFEGNQAFNFDSDTGWGNSIYITVFRNHFTGRRRSVPPIKVTDEMNHRAVGLTINHWWYSFVGNVLGTEGQSPAPAKSFVYEKNDGFGDWTRASMWQLGYEGQKWSPPQDVKVVATTIRHANFDYVTKQVVWDARFPRKLPASFYLPAKPAFLGDEPWPFVDPERMPKMGILPARRRFDAIHGLK